MICTWAVCRPRDKFCRKMKSNECAGCSQGDSTEKLLARLLVRTCIREYHKVAVITITDGAEWSIEF